MRVRFRARVVPRLGQWRKAENMAIRCAVHFIPFSWQKAGNSSMVKSTALLITL